MAQDRLAKSPFPGMDPYLQAHWSGVHTRLITYAADAIQPQLPGDLVARVEENVRLDVDDVSNPAEPGIADDWSSTAAGRNGRVVELASTTRGRTGESTWSGGCDTPSEPAQAGGDFLIIEHRRGGWLWSGRAWRSCRFGGVVGRGFG